MREAAISRFAEIGFPTTRDEDWKYTNVARVVGIPFRPAFELRSDGRDAAAVAARQLGEPAWPRLVFLNGRFAPELSGVTGLSVGVRVESLAAKLSDDGEDVRRNLTRYARYDANGFAALSAAFFEDGAFVSLPERVELDVPIELLFVSAATAGEVATYPRVLVICGRQSRCALIETHVSLGGATLANAVAEVVLGEDAELEHVRVVREARGAAHVATTEVVQGRDSRYTSRSFALDCGFFRHNLNVRLDGPGAQCTLDGLYLADADDFVDNHTAIDHAAPHGTSRELYKGVLSGRARAVFNGKVVVRAGAQKTDAQQTNKNLLLSGTAEIDTKPELQISADDVKCAHGAAIGQLDPEMVFYLKSRGIGEAGARRLLTHGFGVDVIRRVSVEALRTKLEQAFLDRLERDLGDGR